MSCTLTESRLLLPKGFVPSLNQVIIGRGKKCWQHEGNKRLRNIIQSELHDYRIANSKVDKSAILLRVMHQIRQNNRDQIGFVKRDRTTGRWLELTEVASRVAVAQAFRDALSHHYKSSKQSKQRRRRVQKLQSWTSCSSSSEDNTITATVTKPKGQNHYTPSSVRDGFQRPINLGKFGTGLLQIPPTVLREEDDTDWDETQRSRSSGGNTREILPEMLLSSGRTAMESQLPPPPLQMMMMPQPPQPISFSSLPWAMDQYPRMPPSTLMMPLATRRSVGATTDGPFFPYHDPLRVNFSHEVLADGTGFLDSNNDEGEDDFVDIFHDTPLSTIKAALLH